MPKQPNACWQIPSCRRAFVTFFTNMQLKNPGKGDAPSDE